jgi:uncharacterized protein YeaO (DUF488 family)
MPKKVSIKRVYEPASDSDGQRLLVDRVWPRGLTKEKAAVTQWLKDIAPSTALRKWFGHDPEKWTEFHARYRHELEAQAEAMSALKAAVKKKHTTLLYAAKDETHNNAVVLAEILNEAEA